MFIWPFLIIAAQELTLSGRNLKPDIAGARRNVRTPADGHFFVLHEDAFSAHYPVSVGCRMHKYMFLFVRGLQQASRLTGCAIFR